MRFVFTKDTLRRLFIENLPVVQNGQMVDVKPADSPKPYIVFDEDPRAPQGLGFYVGKKKRTFVLQVRVGKTIKKVTVGDYPRFNVNTGSDETDIRLIASDVRTAMKRGIDVTELKRGERVYLATSLKEIFDNYLRLYKLGKSPRKNSVLAIEAAMKRLKPWMALSIRAIGRETVEEIWEEVAVKQEHRTAAEQTLMWCRAAFNVYIEGQQASQNKASFSGDILINPFLYARRFMRKRQELEEQYLENGVRNPLNNDPNHLGAWLNAVWEKRQSNRSAADYLLTTLLVGARRNETARLVWSKQLGNMGPKERSKFSEVDLEANDGRGRLIFRETKNGTTHIVPIGNFLRWLLMERFRDFGTNMYVFPSNSKNPKTQSPYYNSAREFVYSLRKHLDSDKRKLEWDSYWAERQNRNGPSVPGVKKTVVGEDLVAAKADFELNFKGGWNFTMHDLRRTFCTVAVNIEGMPYAVVQHLMNHGQLSNVTARYGRPGIDTLQDYMQRLETEILKHGTNLPKPHILLETLNGAH
jgi:integrase